MRDPSAQISPTVAVIRCESYDVGTVRAAVRRGLDLLGGPGCFARRGERILLKPNLLVPRAPERAVTTHPAVFRAVAEVLRDAGAALSYGDSPGFGTTAWAARRAGLVEVAEELDIPIADFAASETVSFPEGRLIKQFTLARGVLETDGIISLPKMKTHGLTRITGAIKNQFGCIVGPLKPEFHARLPNADLFSRMLVDLNRFLRARLYVMDGIVAMEGNGPQSGTPRPMGVMLMSEDPVALDGTACRLIDLDPALVPPLVHGEALGLGRLSGVEYVGDSVEEFVAEGFDVNRSPRSTTDRPGRGSRLMRRLVVPRPVIRPERCTRCGTCVGICPVSPKAVRFADERRSCPPTHDYERCIRCYCCQEMCPEEAIEIDVPLLGRVIRR
jgi:uncharacterized protein (DUF362 family)/Pyruvate/2-oxoacid:ferredoxin oxidoreductase delta subunit